jgi:hypothetical protein
VLLGNSAEPEAVTGDDVALLSALSYEGEDERLAEDSREVVEILRVDRAGGGSWGGTVRDLEEVGR